MDKEEMKKRFLEALENGEDNELLNAAQLALEDRGIEDIAEVESVSLKKDNVRVQCILECGDSLKRRHFSIPIEELFEKLVW